MPIKVNLPDGRVVNFPDGMPPEAISAEVAKLAAPQESAQAGPQRTWTDTAIDALPTAGGFIGSLAGGGKWNPIGMAGAAIGGAGGEAIKQTANAVRGRMDLVPGSMSGQLASIGSQGLLQGGVEGGGRIISRGLQAVAKPIYNLGLGASKALRREYPNLAQTGLEEGISVSGRGTAKAGRLVTQSAKEADSLIAQAEQAGAPRVSPKRVVTGTDAFRDVAKSARHEAQMGMSNDIDTVVGRVKTLQANNPKGFRLQDAQEKKRVAQAAADKAFRAEDKGAQVSGIGAQLDKATATGLRKSISDIVPAVGPVNARTQALGGLKGALDDAGTRNHMLSRLMWPLATGATAGFGSGDAGQGIGAAITTAALTSPGNLSRGALGMYKAGQLRLPENLLRAAILARLEDE